MMYGKYYKSTYTGSMYGAGLAVFAVWPWIVSNAVAGIIEINPRQLADTLGGTVEDVKGAIEYLMRPDPESRHKECEGRRLIKEGEYQYRIPSWGDYQRIRDAQELREYNAGKKREERARKRNEGLRPVTAKEQVAHAKACQANKDLNEAQRKAQAEFEANQSSQEQKQQENQ